MKYKINLPPLHLACDNNELRPALSCISITDGIAVATNAHILIHYPLAQMCEWEESDITNSNGKLIHMNVWKEMCKADSISFFYNNILIKKNGLEIFAPYEHNGTVFPGWKQVIEHSKNVGNNPIYKIGIDIKYLIPIQKIMGGIIDLYFTSEKDAIVILPAQEYNGVFAVFMPCITNYKHDFFKS
jgi:hypothetical protein